MAAQPMVTSGMLSVPSISGRQGRVGDAERVARRDGERRPVGRYIWDLFPQPIARRFPVSPVLALTKTR